MFKLQANTGSEQPLEHNGAASNVLKTDDEVPKARARRGRPEAEQLSRTRRDIDRDHAYARGGAARARPARRLLAHTSLPKFTGRLVPDGLSAGATPSLPRVSRLALRFLPPENFGRPHSETMGSHARR